MILSPLSGVSTPVGDDLIDALAGSPDAVVSSGVLPGSAFTFLLDTMSGVRAWTRAPLVILSSPTLRQHCDPYKEPNDVRARADGIASLRLWDWV